MNRPRARTGRSIGIGVLIAGLFVSACQLLAGIDEKVAAAPPTNTDAEDNTTPVVDGGSDADTAPPPPECTKHADCVAKNGENFICVKPEQKCRSLLSPDCQTIIAGVRGGAPQAKQEVLQDDNTIFFGFIMDLNGSGKNAGIARRQAVELAAGDIHSVVRGISGGVGGKRRPIAYVACSETKDATAAADPKVPAKHLVEDLHVAAIIGASNSDTTIDLFNGYALSKGTLVFSPNALSSALSSPSDNGLFWRTSATSILQGTAVQQHVAKVEQEELTAGTHKLAMIYIQDAFGTDIFPHVQNGMKFNNALLTDTGVNGPPCSATPCNPLSKIFIKQYPANTPADVMLAVGNELNTFAPDIVVAIGRKDAVQIAANAETAGLRAYYLFTQGSATSDVTTILTTSNANGVRVRVRGGRPLAAPDEATVFVPLYNQAFPGGPASGNGVPGCFDITYLLTYAAAAAPGDTTEPLTGARMNEGLKKVLNKSAADAFKVGTADLVKALEAIQGNKQINTKGVSYIFDFDTAVGEAPGKVDIWCVSSNSNALKSSGLVYDPGADGGTTSGVYNCPLN